MITNLRAIMAMYGVSISYISKRFGIPYRTVQHWASEGTDHRDCPEYVLQMIDELLLIEASSTTIK